MPGSISVPPSWKQSVHHVLRCPLSSGCCCQSCLNSLHFTITVYACSHSVTLHDSNFWQMAWKEVAKYLLRNLRWVLFRQLPQDIHDLSACNTEKQRKYMPHQGHTLPLISHTHYSCKLFYGIYIVLLPTAERWYYLLSMLNGLWGKGEK